MSVGAYAETREQRVQRQRSRLAELRARPHRLGTPDAMQLAWLEDELARDAQDHGVPELPLTPTGGPLIEGYAAVFDHPSGPRGDLAVWREVLGAGAFRRVLAARPPVLLVLEHDLDQVLASTVAGTLQLWEDEIGLRVRAHLSGACPGARRALRLLEAGMLRMSFALAHDRRDWEIRDAKVFARIPRDGVCGLVEVSLVAEPDYADTAVSVVNGCTGRAWRQPRTLTGPADLYFADRGDAQKRAHPDFIAELLRELVTTRDNPLPLLDALEARGLDLTAKRRTR